MKSYKSTQKNKVFLSKSTPYTQQRRR